MSSPLSWIEIDSAAIRQNLSGFRERLPEGTRMMAVVKGEAYGHGMLLVARTALAAGVDWLGVFHLGEATQLRREGIEAPILVLGYVPQKDLEQAIELKLRITASSLTTVEAAAAAAAKLGQTAKLHLKLETGTNRLGLCGEELNQAIQTIETNEYLEAEGAHTHYANIEDTTEHGYARGQLERFKDHLQELTRAGLEVPLPHTACTAAAILFPETYFQMVRVGIGQYGLWPSKETFLSALKEGREALSLTPALTWKTMVAQVKTVAKGSFVGYGCTYRTTRETRLAILPVGYANGYDRLLSNQGHVLIRGQRAPIRGRVCMNLTMVDVTDIAGASIEDEVVLLGAQGEESISAEQMAAWAQTINYEVVTRADPHAPRVVMENSTRKHN